MALQNSAVQAHFDRRRRELNNTTVGWQDRWQQAKNLGSVTGRIVTRSITKK